MVAEMANRKRPVGRPRKAPKDKLMKGKFLRLTRRLEAVVEVRRQAMEREKGVGVEWTEAARDLIEAGAVSRQLLPADAAPIA